MAASTSSVLRIAALVLASAALVAAGAAAVVIRWGLYDTTAASSHTQAVHSLLEIAMHRSVQWHARGVKEEPATRAEPLRGAACYREHCEACHGAPGIAPQAMSLGMQPLPGALVDAHASWRLRELYWIVRHGIKMSGMPAWGHRLPDEALWAVSRHVAQMGASTPAQYAAQRREAEALACDAGPDAAASHGPPDIDAGPLALRQYGCNGCHVIPGVTGADIAIGPPLAGLGRRAAIAGGLPLSREALVQWIREPQRLRPGSAMPALGVTREHAEQMADYLLSLH